MFARKILKELYDSEINFSLYTMWDAGAFVRFGDEMNGFGEVYEVDMDIYTIALFIAKKACELYPKSSFASWFKNNHIHFCSEENTCGNKIIHIHGDNFDHTHPCPECSNDYIDRAMLILKD